jgi:hypothetical protein
MPASQGPVNSHHVWASSDLAFVFYINRYALYQDQELDYGSRLRGLVVLLK